MPFSGLINAMKSTQSGTTTSVATVLRGLLGRLGLTASLSRHAIVESWPRIVGSQVARHAKAEKVTGATLHIAVDSAVWMNELAAMKNLLLEKLNKHIDPEAMPVAEIRFSQRSWAKERKPRPSRPKPPPPTEQEIQVVGEILKPLKNDKLKLILKRILEKDRQLKWRRGHGEERSREGADSACLD